MFLSIFFPTSFLLQQFFYGRSFFFSWHFFTSFCYSFGSNFSSQFFDIFHDFLKFVIFSRFFPSHFVDIFPLVIVSSFFDIFHDSCELSFTIFWGRSFFLHIELTLFHEFLLQQFFWRLLQFWVYFFLTIFRIFRQVFDVFRNFGCNLFDISQWNYFHDFSRHFPRFFVIFSASSSSVFFWRFLQFCFVCRVQIGKYSHRLASAAASNISFIFSPDCLWHYFFTRLFSRHFYKIDDDFLSSFHFFKTVSTKFFVTFNISQPVFYDFFHE